MRILYNTLFNLFFVLSAPYYFWRLRRRGNWQKGFSQRFGQYDAKFKQAITNRHTLWMHAVSVGEVGLCIQVIRALEARFPNLKIVVSTTTTTGMGELQRKLPHHISKIYYPVDKRSVVVRALSTVHPIAIVLVEAEIWPNFLWRAQELRIPVFLINARLSNRSFPRYKRFRKLFGPLFGGFAGVGAQNEADAEKLRQVGCRPEAVHVVGSLKFDTAKLEGRPPLDVPAMLRQLGVAAHAPVLVAGSTHNGEEALLAEQFLRLRQRFPDLFLVLVPRHFERCPEVARELSSRGVPFVFRQDLKPGDEYQAGQVQCLLVNSTGELKYFYQQATVVFVGKSLTAQGGQNPIEPAALGKAVVCGPNMQNFADVVQAFLAQDAVVQVGDSAELETVLGQLLADASRREALGRRALQVVQQNQGALERTVDIIVERLSKSELYVVPKGAAPRPAPQALSQARPSAAQ